MLNPSGVLAILCCAQFLPIFLAKATPSTTCPRVCACDVIAGMNRANCSSHNLQDAQISVPTIVEILDLSDNSIASLDSSSFEGMRHLLSLHIANNALNAIALNTFGSLRKLQNLSLADNRLEWFDAGIVEVATRLEWLDMSGNKLMDAPTDEPLLRSASVRVLLLARVQMTAVGFSMLTELPALERLDLSGNLLIQLQAGSFSTNRRLEWLNVVENPFNCDRNMQYNLQSLARRMVTVISGKCVASTLPPKRSNGTPMFERMIMKPISTTAPPTTPITEADLSAVWHSIEYYDEDSDSESTACPPDNHTKTCQLLRHCHDQLSNANAYNIPKMPRMLSVRPALYAGMLIGTVFGGFIVYAVMLVRESCIKRHKRQQPRLQRTYVIRERNHDHEQDLDFAEAPMLTDDAASNGAPAIVVQQLETPPATENYEYMPGTRRRAGRLRRPLPTEAPRLGRRKTVYNWLFDRRAHRRYVRTISENTGNLVRRLSQSRLFLNFSGGTATAQRSQAAAATGDTLVVVPVMYPEAMIRSSPTDAPAAVVRPSAPALGSAASALLRPETPPPMYGDIVKFEQRHDK